jgi:hypothetical protein
MSLLPLYHIVMRLVRRTDWLSILCLLSLLPVNSPQRIVWKNSTGEPAEIRVWVLLADQSAASKKMAVGACVRGRGNRERGETQSIASWLRTSGRCLEWRGTWPDNSSPSLVGLDPTPTPPPRLTLPRTFKGLSSYKVKCTRLSNVQEVSFCLVLAASWPTYVLLITIWLWLNNVKDTYFVRFVLITRYYQADQVRENELGRACGTHGRGEKRVQDFGGKARRKKTTWKTKA